MGLCSRSTHQGQHGHGSTNAIPADHAGQALQAVAQGNVDDLPSLVKAPNSKRARAGVGVAETESLPPVHALWKLEDGVITS